MGTKRVEIELIRRRENLLVSEANAEVRANPQTPFVYYGCTFDLDEPFDTTMTNVACISCYFAMRDESILATLTTSGKTRNDR